MILQKHAPSSGFNGTNTLVAHPTAPLERSICSYCTYGFDCRIPTKAALLPAKPLRPTNVTDYREQMMLSLPSARNLAKEVNRAFQKKYKAQYDKSARDPKLRTGDWVLV